MPYLVDSDWVIDYLAGVPEALALLERLANEGLAISVVTYMEVYEGVARAERPEEAGMRFDALVEAVPLLPISPAIARRCAVLRETLRRQGKRVNRCALDLLIAATALDHELTLVTRNLADYADIPDLETYGGEKR